MVKYCHTCYEQGYKAPAMREGSAHRCRRCNALLGHVLYLDGDSTTYIDRGCLPSDRWHSTTGRVK